MAASALWDNEEVAQDVRMQVTKWRINVKEIEELMSACVHTDGQINDLLVRVRGQKETETRDLELSQEAIIRARIKAQQANGTEVAGSKNSKSQKERKLDMLELRHELPKMGEAPAAGGDEDALRSPVAQRQSVHTSQLLSSS